MPRFPKLTRSASVHFGEDSKPLANKPQEQQALDQWNFKGDRAGWTELRAPG